MNSSIYTKLALTTLLVGCFNQGSLQASCTTTSSTCPEEMNCEATKNCPDKKCDTPECCDTNDCCMLDCATIRNCPECPTNKKCDTACPTKCDAPECCDTTRSRCETKKSCEADCDRTACETTKAKCPVCPINLQKTVKLTTLTALTYGFYLELESLKKSNQLSPAGAEIAKLFYGKLLIDSISDDLKTFRTWFESLAVQAQQAIAEQLGRLVA